MRLIRPIRLSQQPLYEERRAVWDRDLLGKPPLNNEETQVKPGF